MRGVQPRVASERPATVARRTTAESAPGSERKYLYMALGIVVFFVVVEGADIIRRGAEHLPVRAAKALLAPPSQTSDRTLSVSPAGLTPEEFARILPHLAGKFAMIDTNGDGRVSDAELHAYWQRERAQGTQPAKK